MKLDGLRLVTVEARWWPHWEIIILFWPFLYVFETFPTTKLKEKKKEKGHYFSIIFSQVCNHFGFVCFLYIFVHWLSITEHWHVRRPRSHSVLYLRSYNWEGIKAWPVRPRLTQGAPGNKECIKFLFTMYVTHVKFTAYQGHQSTSHAIPHSI